MGSQQQVHHPHHQYVHQQQQSHHQNRHQQHRHHQHYQQRSQQQQQQQHHQHHQQQQQQKQVMDPSQDVSSGSSLSKMGVNRTYIPLTSSNSTLTIASSSSDTSEVDSYFTNSRSDFNNLQMFQSL